MKALPDSGILEEDARIIVSYLASQMGQKGSLAAASLEVARAVVDQRCGRCHSLDRVYKTAETPEEWRATVYRMVAFAQGSGNAFQAGEDEQIIGYLSATQTPDAVNQRKAQVAAASSAGRSMVTPTAAAAADRPAPPSRYDVRTMGFVAFVFLSMLTLVVRRPSRRRRIEHTCGNGESTRAGGLGYLTVERSARLEVGERRAADFGCKNLALRCYRWPAAERATRPVSNVLFSLRR
jgi:hypothetical protein